MGVELRIHTFFVMLLGLSFFSPSGNGSSMSVWRGIGLWGAMFSAVVVRETARLLTAAYYGVELRSILLLPIGGLFSYSNPESQERATSGHAHVALSLAGPVANLLFAGAIAGLVLGASPHLNLVEVPWITPLHLIRTWLWLNVALGVLNLLPAYPLDGGRLIRGSYAKVNGTIQATRAASSLGQLLAIAAFIAGIIMQNTWITLAAFFIFIGAQMEDQGMLFQTIVDTVQMKDVMLTQFSTLSASETLEDALYRTIHTLQDDFPVVRGSILVGIISRHQILDALRAEGNTYVQSVMSRGFQVATPEDSLGGVLRKLSGGDALALLPVTEEGRVVGIVSRQNLMHSMGLLAEHRRLQASAQQERE